MQTSERLYQLFLENPVVSTDTRNLPEGCLFFALKGERFNGNQFAGQALEQGAAFAVVDEPVTGAPPERVITVPNVLSALQELANRYRQSFFIPVIAVGGSNGKTTTKELLSAVLGAHYACHATPGNLNNHIGVPLTLLRMPPNTEVAIVEMGTNQPGDIELLCRIAEPTHGLLTNIGKEHLEKLIDLEGVKKEEGALYRYLAERDGCAFVNLTEKHLLKLAKPVRKKVLYTATDKVEPQIDQIKATLVSAFPQIEAAFMSDAEELIEVRTNLFGLHNFQNVLTAIALGIYFRVPAKKIKAAVEQYIPANNRSQIVRSQGGTFVLDAYNANPSSMHAALDSFVAMPTQQKSAVLGDMLEVGENGLAEHQAVLNKALRLHPDPLVLIGPMFGQCKRPRRVRHFFTATEAADWLGKQDWQHKLVLVKGSRGMKLELAMAQVLSRNAATPA